jgi:predicted type IV restriction endonuclease
MLSSRARRIVHGEGTGMDFASKIADLARRSLQAAKTAQTEEAIKTSVVLPLIQALGFDPFNLDEVTPEFVADIGTKKGEKIDFALKIGDRVAMLVEAKPIGMALGANQISQLFRYFGVKDVKIALLTNGRELWFFSDFEAQNRMDQTPFFKFDLQQYDAAQLDDLSRFQRENFNLDAIRETAINIKYANAAAAFLKRQLSNPDDEFVKLVGREIHKGSLTKSALDVLRPAIQNSLEMVLKERIQEKLSVAFPAPPVETVIHTSPAPESDAEVVTTDEELQAFMIVKAIAARVISVQRITIRDAKSYCSVFVDDNNRKPVCRLYFNTKSSRSIGLFLADKTETKHTLQSLNDIFAHSAAIESAVSAYV